MNRTDTAIPDVCLLDPVLHGDERGFFMETWNRETFRALGLDVEFIQDNHSRSVQGTLRGLHYQIRCPQGKLVRVIAGTVFDVVVDLRRSSPTFGRWTGVELSAGNHRMMWIPPGCAHGFYVLSPVADFLYKCTDRYAPEHERTLRWDDPDLAIDWPLLKGVRLLLSDRDRAGTPLRRAETFDVG